MIEGDVEQGSHKLDWTVRTLQTTFLVYSSSIFMHYIYIYVCTLVCFFEEQSISYIYTIGLILHTPCVGYTVPTISVDFNSLIYVCVLLACIRKGTKTMLITTDSR